MYDLLRQYRKPGALCSNDAIGCFDRMIHSVVMLLYKRLGVPEPAVHCMLESIRNMKHYIRTGFGISTMKISSEGYLTPYQGALQGNEAAPTSWVIINQHTVIKYVKNSGSWTQNYFCHKQGRLPLCRLCVRR